MRCLLSNEMSLVAGGFGFQQIEGPKNLPPVTVTPPAGMTFYPNGGGPSSITCSPGTSPVYREGGGGGGTGTLVLPGKLVDLSLGGQGKGESTVRCEPVEPRGSNHGPSVR